jgi:hypothetical protein
MSNARRPAAWLAAGLLGIAGLPACRSNGGDDAAQKPAPSAAAAPSKPAPPPAPAPADAGPPMAEPSNAQPVVVAASLTPPEIAAGGTAVLTIRVKIAPSWHIYPIVPGGGPNAPTEFGLDLPEGLLWVDDWGEPVPSREPLTHAAIHTGTVEFRRTLKAAAAAAAGARALDGWMSYQVCDPMMCRPPARIEWSATLTVLAAAGAAIPDPKQTRAEAPPAGKIDLRILYLGAADGATGRAAAKAARTHEMVDFLRTRFADVRAADRDHFERGSERDADVVLLDWSQSEIDLAQLEKLESPIGPREAWNRPLVLLGSAGLLLGVPWRLKGGFG